MSEPSSDVLPAARVFYAADLSWAKAELGAQLSTLTANLRSLSYLYGLRRRYLHGAALLSILHGAVSPHVHLIVEVGRPSQVLRSVIRWVTIVMRDVGMRWRRRKSDEGKRYEPMDHLSYRRGPRILAQYERDIPERVMCPLQHNRRVSARGARVAPNAQPTSPRAHATEVTNLVIRETVYRKPSLGGLHGH